MDLGPIYDNSRFIGEPGNKLGKPFHFTGQVKTLAEQKISNFPMDKIVYTFKTFSHHAQVSHDLTITFFYTLRS